MVLFDLAPAPNSPMPGGTAPSRTIFCLRYEGSPRPTLAASNGNSLNRAIFQLEQSAAYLADVVQESATGRVMPNPWNSACVAGFLGSPLAHAVSSLPQAVGLGEDRNGQLLVSASMSGVVGFLAPRSSEAAVRLSFLGHDVKNVRDLWINSLSCGDLGLKLYEANDCFLADDQIWAIVPQVHLSRGRFWDTVHFDARTNYALAMREFEKARIVAVPTDEVVTHHCRDAASLVFEGLSDAGRLQRFENLRNEYRLPVSDAIVLLPTAGLSAPRIGDLPLSIGRYDPDPFEMVMPAVLSDSIAITVPNGFSADGLPMGLMMMGPATMSGRLFALADWFQRVSGWPTVATR